MSVSIAAEEQFKRHSTVVNYAKDMLQILSDDGLLRKSQESCEIVEAVKNKNRKAKERTADTIKSTYLSYLLSSAELLVSF